MCLFPLSRLTPRNILRQLLGPVPHASKSFVFTGSETDGELLFCVVPATDKVSSDDCKLVESSETVGFLPKPSIRVVSVPSKHIVHGNYSFLDPQ